MRTAPAIVAFLLAFPFQTYAQAPARPSPWHADVAASVFGEAWDHNESTEWLTGIMVGVDRRVWRGLAIRAEALAQRVFQEGENAWLAGGTVGARARWRRRTPSPVIDIAVGVSEAHRPVPPRGTSFNYLALMGAGFEMPLGRLSATVTGRWLHASNAGREGNHRNPDIQSLGLVFGVRF